MNRFKVNQPKYCSSITSTLKTTLLSKLTANKSTSCWNILLPKQSWKRSDSKKYIY